jgi:hypothetical protein
MAAADPFRTAVAMRSATYRAMLRETTLVELDQVSFVSRRVSTLEQSAVTLAYSCLGGLM